MKVELNQYQVTNDCIWQGYDNFVVFEEQTHQIQQDLNLQVDFEKPRFSKSCSVVVLLNYLSLPLNFQTSWNSASLRICADGGATLFLQLCSQQPNLQLKAPEFVKGDLDSINPQVLQQLKQMGTKIIRDSSQDTNDLQKCFHLIYQIQDQHNFQV
eukprot:TRINITY_DN1424_c0_g4_i2.p1 TRINITY_DN1424_c0_g4~~TRINITY_DN1424_c0_g4_i2.p1  ORF type:complete len:156 (+),score=46.27 TRINITY_DN1424_c0_g4_i2:113-580(+)